MRTQLFSMILIIKAFRPKTNNEATNKKKIMMIIIIINIPKYENDSPFRYFIQLK